jgi:hypothetical protein
MMFMPELFSLKIEGEILSKLDTPLLKQSTLPFKPVIIKSKSV